MYRDEGPSRIRTFLQETLIYKSIYMLGHGGYGVELKPVSDLAVARGVSLLFYKGRYEVECLALFFG